MDVEDLIPDEPNKIVTIFGGEGKGKTARSPENEVNRYTIDLDDSSREYALFRVWQILNNQCTEKVFLRRSSSGEGHHIEVWEKIPEYLPFRKLNVHRRFGLGDDPKRIQADLRQWGQGAYSGDVLFNEKEGNTPTKWEVYKRQT